MDWNDAFLRNEDILDEPIEFEESVLSDIRSSDAGFYGRKICKMLKEHNESMEKRMRDITNRLERIEKMLGKN